MFGATMRAAEGYSTAAWGAGFWAELRMVFIHEELT